MSELKLTVDLRLLDGHGQLRGFADVTISFEAGEITVKGFRIVQKDGQAPWIGFPTISYTKDGQKINKPVLEVSRTLHRQIVDAILAGFPRNIAGN